MLLELRFKCHENKISTLSVLRVLIPRKRRHFNSPMFDEAQVCEHFNDVAGYVLVKHIPRAEVESVKIFNIVIVPAV